MRLLLFEDDPRMADTAAQFLRNAGFAVDVAPDGATALREADINPYDAAVLDLGLPDLDGLEVCRRLRARKQPLRILMATARDAVEDCIAGLDTGADDYVVKPYALGELVARLRALLRRPAESLPAVLRVGELALDTVARTAVRGARRIGLTTKEFAVLKVLLRHPGAVLTREHISEHAWDQNYDPLSDIIDVYIGRLRRKIDAPGESPMLETVRGAGYRLSAGASAAVRSASASRAGTRVRSCSSCSPAPGWRAPSCATRSRPSSSSRWPRRSAWCRASSAWRSPSTGRSTRRSRTARGS